jgi:hypothetical protein
MTSIERTEKTVGSLFLVAMVTSLLGGGMIESILQGPDSLALASAHPARIAIAVFLELINAIAVVGIAVALFPVLKRFREGIALGYVGFRIIESMSGVIGALIPLTLITMGREYAQAGVSDASLFIALGALIKEARGHWVGLALPLFFSLGALLLYVSLYRTKLVPRFIPVWGLVGVASLVALNGLGIFDVRAGMILALPIILNEIFLAIWLIVKGFDPSALSRGHGAAPGVAGREPTDSRKEE